jgi:DNA-binding response OmpR family regulator
MAQQKILVIEDDPAVRAGIVDALRYAGYAALEADEGPGGLESAVRANYDLLLLDLVLPGLDGLEILKEVRRTRPTLPVIILTARGGEDERIAGLRLGADDYVVKPFSVKELLARVEAVMRRTPGRPDEVADVPFPAGVADVGRRQVRYDDGGRCELTEREAALLRYLAGNAGRPVARDEILASVWRVNPAGFETRTIDMHVARLREKLRDDPSAPRVILTVRGKGYMFAGAEGEG